MEYLTFTQPHREALTVETQNAFRRLGRLPFIQRYYLAGGTGLANARDVGSHALGEDEAFLRTTGCRNGA